MEPAATAIAGKINASLNPLTTIQQLKAGVIASQAVQSYLEPAHTDLEVLTV